MATKDDKTIWEWGPRVATRGLKDLYRPQKVQRFTVPPAGIDNLALSSKDTFLVPGQGEVEAEFEGFFRVARAKPTSQDWAKAAVYVNVANLFLRGRSDQLGEITVRRNPDRVSPGQTFGPGAAQAAAKCRIATSALFSVQGLDGMTLFNKEPILLMNDGIDAIPPVEDPNGEAYIYRLPLYDQAKPDGRPVAYLTGLRYTVGNYVTTQEATRFRKQERAAR
jgi:hypothetical protein